MKMLGHNFEATSSQTLYMLHFQQTLFEAGKKENQALLKVLKQQNYKKYNQNLSLIG